MALLKRCPQHSCYELIPVDAGDCGKHKHRKPMVCACGCGGQVFGQAKYTPDCRLRRLREAAQSKKGSYEARKTHDNEAVAAMKEYTQIKQIKPWTPRPKPKPLMTDAEQSKLDREISDKLNEKCGYFSSPVKIYSKAEIAAFAAAIN